MDECECVRVRAVPRKLLRWLYLGEDKGCALPVASHRDLLRPWGPTGAGASSVGPGAGLRDARQTPGSWHGGRAVPLCLTLPAAQRPHPEEGKVLSQQSGRQTQESRRCLRGGAWAEELQLGSARSCCGFGRAAHWGC